MKALQELTNTEKGKLLADLFPMEIPAMLEAMESCYASLKQQEHQVRAKWDNPIFTANFWFALADDCLGIIRRYKNKKLMNSRIFSDQLFYGYRALYTVDCILKFSRSCEGRPKFKLAVDLLFDV